MSKPSEVDDRAPPLFYIDENLPKYLATGLHGFGENVHHVRDVSGLGPSASDVAIIQHIGTHAGVLITQDQRMQYRPTEKQALKKARIGCFVLIGKPPKTSEAEKWSLIWQFTRLWLKIKKITKKEQTTSHRSFAYQLRRRSAKIEKITL